VERFSVGTVLGAGLRAVPRALLRFGPFALVCHAPLLYLSSDWLALSILLELPAIAALTHDVLQPTTVLDALRVALRRIPAVVGTMLLVLLVALGVTVAMSTPLIGAVEGDSSVIAVLAWLVWVGLMLVLYARWFVAVPVAVVERGGVTALERSGRLTRGYRGVLVAVLLVEIAPTVLAVLFLDAIPQPVLLALVVAVGLLRACCSAAAYRQLTITRELAEVFA